MNEGFMVLRLMPFLIYIGGKSKQVATNLSTILFLGFLSSGCKPIPREEDQDVSAAQSVQSEISSNYYKETLSVDSSGKNLVYEKCKVEVHSGVIAYQPIEGGLGQKSSYCQTFNNPFGVVIARITGSEGCEVAMRDCSKSKKGYIKKQIPISSLNKLNNKRCGDIIVRIKSKDEWIDEGGSRSSHSECFKAALKLFENN